MSKKVWELSLNGDTFNALKTDFDQMLRKTLSNMEQRENEQAEITIKVKITLTKDTAPDLENSAYASTREIIRPKFDHKVASVMQYKDEASGTLSGNYELVWDKEIGDYVMREITNGQTSLFDDEDEKPVEDKKEQGIAQIEGNTPGALPPPKDAIDAIDAEFREVDDQDKEDNAGNEELGGEEPDDDEPQEPEDSQDDDYRYDDPDGEADDNE